MRCTTTEGTTYSLTVISHLTTSKVILFYMGISMLEKRVQFIFELPMYN